MDFQEVLFFLNIFFFGGEGIIELSRKMKWL